MSAFSFDVAALHDGGATTSKLTSKLRVAQSNGKRALRNLIDRLDAVIQADGTIAGGDKTTSTNYKALIDDDTFFDKIVKKI